VNSPCSAASPRSWPPTTAPPNSNAASTSSLPAWPAPCPRRTGRGPPARSRQRQPGPGAVSDFASGAQDLGAARYGGGGAQGVSPAATALLPVTLPGILPATATRLTASTRGGLGQLDAVLLTPLISVLITTGNGHSVALLSSEARTVTARTLSLPGTGRAVATSYDDQGHLWRVTTSTGAAITVPVPPGGFAIVQRETPGPRWRN
jgi:hypothetical protein